MSKGHKKPKDPNAPKKNQSSYFLFSNSRRSDLQRENKDKSITDISKIISAEWKAMDGPTKKSFEVKAAEDKKRYLSQFSEYSKTENHTKFTKKLNEWKENERLHGRGRGGKKGKGPKKPKQPDSMPKRPQSSYFIFSNERRNELKNVYPDKKITELSKLIAEEWKIKTSEEKKFYEDKAAINKEKYQKDIAIYKETEEYEQYQKKITEWKVEKKRWEQSNDDSDDQPKVSLPRKPKDDKCPKRPLTSYFLYAKEVREATKAEFPNKAITEIAKEISKKWKVLTEDEKKPYNDEAARLKEQYKKDLAEYDGSDAQKAYQQKLEEWKQECHRRKESAKKKHLKKLQKAEEEEMKKKKKKSPKKKQTKKTSKKKQRQRMDTDSDSSSGSDSDSDSDSSSGSTSSSSSGSGSTSSSGSDSDSDSSSSSD